jgi:hypothetical protein
VGKDANQASTKAMINNIVSTGVHAVDIAALRQNRAKKTEPAQDTSVETAKTQKPAHPAHPRGHIPPGLARAAENIASKIFARADADANGTVTLQELSAVHSKHARILASSDLFQTATVETPADAATTTTIEAAADTAGATSDTATSTITETTTETPGQVGVTEAQLKEALTKFFYAKVGAAYTSPAPPTTEQLAPTAPANTSTSSIVASISDESAADRTLTAVA